MIASIREGLSFSSQGRARSIRCCPDICPSSFQASEPNSHRRQAPHESRRHPRTVPRAQGHDLPEHRHSSRRCAPAKEAYERAAHLWSTGRFDWMEAERAGEDSRAMFAQIVGASPAEVAIVPAVSSAAGIIAASMPPAGPGENIVVAESEFSSNYFPWLLLRERGYEVRPVSSVDGAFSADAHVADGGTRLIAASAVQAATGYRVDLAALSRVAARSGAWLFVDACQAAGAVPIDVVRDGVDFHGGREPQVPSRLAGDGSSVRSPSASRPNSSDGSRLEHHAETARCVSPPAGVQLRRHALKQENRRPDGISGRLPASIAASTPVSRACPETSIESIP